MLLPWESTVLLRHRSPSRQDRAPSPLAATGVQATRAHAAPRSRGWTSVPLRGRCPVAAPTIADGEPSVTSARAASAPIRYTRAGRPRRATRQPRGALRLGSSALEVTGTANGDRLVGLSVHEPAEPGRMCPSRARDQSPAKGGLQLERTRANSPTSTPESRDARSARQAFAGPQGPSPAGAQK